MALCNRTAPKAEALARDFGVPPASVYDDAEAMIRREKPDVVDVITDLETHARFVKLAAVHGVPVICQKPMATSLAEAESMVSACRQAGVPFFVHENWRWQTPVRAVKQVLAEGKIGTPFRAHIRMASGFPVFANQPFLATLEQFILTDMGSHILDVARFLFGEAASVYCQTHHVHRDLKGENVRGEDVATVILRTRAGATVVCELGYPGTPFEHECFPETTIFVEGDRGSVELAPGYWVRTTTRDGTDAQRHPPPRYAWADPAYDVVQASIVPCNQDLLGAVRGEKPAETTGEDNLRTARLVFAAYESAATGRAVAVEA